MTVKLPLKLEEIDPETGCIVRDWHLPEIDIAQLNQLLGGDFSEIGHAAYDLDAADIRKLAVNFDLKDLSFEQGQLRRIHSLIDALPYPVHTGRELAMMLSGKKPFARFVFDEGVDFEEIVQQPFSRYVETGTLCAFTERVSDQNRTTVIYSFTLPGEEWRVAAMAELWKCAQETGWSDRHERREGELLGYEDWQNDAFLALRKKFMNRIVK